MAERPERPRPGPLPSGRHKLTRDAVVASQRGRLLDAIAEAVAEKGYAATTVADIVARAGVSRRTFYEQFADKETCFLEAYDAGIDYVIVRLNEAVGQLRGQPDWRERSHVTIRAFLAVLAEEPEFARTILVEALAAGPTAAARRAAMLTRFADIWSSLHARARAEEPELPRLPPTAFAVLVGGHDELLRDHVRRHGLERLETLAQPLTDATLALLGSRVSGL